MSRFLCVYIPDFAAWAAMQRDPVLRGRAVVIYSSGHIIAASPAARRAGVQTGWSLERAQALLPEAVALPCSGPSITAAWAGVLDSLYSLTPHLESIHCGLALAQIEPPSLIRSLLREWCAQGGVADDRTTAELAARTAVPGVLRVLKPCRSHSFLSGVPVTMLSEVGVGADTIDRLGWFGWRYIGQLRAVSRRHLIAQFPEGELLYHYAQANDTRPLAVYQPPTEITAYYEFEQPAHEPCELEPALDHVVEQACHELQGRVAQLITVSIEVQSRWLKERRLLHEA